MEMISFPFLCELKIWKFAYLNTVELSLFSNSIKIRENFEKKHLGIKNELTYVDLKFLML